MVVVADGSVARTGDKAEEDVLHTEGSDTVLLYMVRSIGGRVRSLVLPRAYNARTALVIITGPGSEKKAWAVILLQSYNTIYQPCCSLPAIVLVE